MQTILFDGSLEGWLCAVFDVYEYKFKDVSICRESEFNGNIFQKIHRVHNAPAKAERVWKGLQQKLSKTALEEVYRCFHSERSDNVLLRYAQYVFDSKTSIENDYGHPDVLEVVQTAKKVWREKHRMEAFVRFQKTGDGLFYAFIEPDYDVLPLIGRHFTDRYADQRWIIYDARRKYGSYYDLEELSPVEVNFSEKASTETATIVYDDQEELYQELWKRYFDSVNIAARKNTRLHLQHMPRRYWKYLTEKSRR